MYLQKSSFKYKILKSTDCLDVLQTDNLMPILHIL